MTKKGKIIWRYNREIQRYLIRDAISNGGSISSFGVEYASDVRANLRAARKTSNRVNLTSVILMMMLFFTHVVEANISILQFKLEDLKPISELVLLASIGLLVYGQLVAEKIQLLEDTLDIWREQNFAQSEARLWEFVDPGFLGDDIDFNVRAPQFGLRTLFLLDVPKAVGMFAVLIAVVVLGLIFFGVHAYLVYSLIEEPELPDAISRLVMVFVGFAYFMFLGYLFERHFPQPMVYDEQETLPPREPKLGGGYYELWITVGVVLSLLKGFCFGWGSWFVFEHADSQIIGAIVETIVFATAACVLGLGSNIALLAVKSYWR